MRPTMDCAANVEKWLIENEGGGHGTSVGGGLQSQGMGSVVDSEFKVDANPGCYIWRCWTVAVGIIQAGIQELY